MKLIGTLTLGIALTNIADAIPSGVLKAQERLRSDIEFAIAACNASAADCQRLQLQDKIMVDLNIYIAGMRDNIAFCQRYAEDADSADKRSEVTEATSNTSRTSSGRVSSLRQCSGKVRTSLPE